MEKIKIAVAGHTNVGKTTLVRNLVKQKIGETGDVSNLTKYPLIIDHPELFAKIIDCPGFQEAGRILDLLENNEDFEILKKKLVEKDLEVDSEAIDAIREADIVFYVVSLEKVPDKSDNSELLLIKKLCNNVIGVINKKYLGSPSEGDKYSELNNRLTQWESFFNKTHIPNVSYNFHWDSPSKILLLFEKANEILSESKKAEFKQSLENYNNQVEEDYIKVANAIIALIKNCKDIRFESVSKNKAEYESKIKELNKRVFDASYIHLITYTDNLKKIYKLAFNSLDKANYSISSIDEILQSSFSKGFENVAKGTVFGAGAGAVLGAYGVAKAATLTLVFTPIGPAVVAGLAIGSLVGLIFGFSSASTTEDTKKLEVSFSENDLTNLGILAISLAWASAYQGYGMSDIVSVDRVEELVKKEIIPKSESLKLKVDFKNDSDFSQFKDKLKVIFETIRL